MRFALASYILLAFGVEANASLCTTISDGDLLDEAIWSCGCEPSLCDTLRIEHALTFSGDVELPNTVLISASGSLTSGGSLTVSGRFENAGSCTVANMVQPNGFAGWSNSGLLSTSEMALFGDSTENYGVIICLDTLRLYSSSRLFNHGRVQGDFFWVGALYNYDSVLFQSGQSQSAFVNFGWFWIDGLLTGVGGVLNEGSSAFMRTDTLWVLGDLNNEGLIRTDLLQFGFEGFDYAVLLTFTETARIECGNLKNYGEMHGSGDICVQDSSINYATGSIDESLDICDASLTVGSAPFVDVNLGSIGPQVGWCDQTGCSTGLADEKSDPPLLMFPNPASGRVCIALGASSRPSALRLIDMCGRIFFPRYLLSGGNLIVDLEGLAAGSYTIVLAGEDDHSPRLAHLSIAVD